MRDLWNWIIPVALIATVLILTAKAVIASYFGAKEAFVDRIIAKLRRVDDGKGTGRTAQQP